MPRTTRPSAKSSSTKSSSAPLLTRDRVASLSDARSFSRGERYQLDERVTDLERAGNVLTGVVEGTDTYSVKIWFEGKSVRFECNCPVGVEGRFCKHLVAAALADIAGGARQAAPTASSDKLRRSLLKESKEALVDLIVEHARRDASLRQLLELRAGTAKSAGRQIERVRSIVERATVKPNIYDQYSYERVFERLEKMADSLEALLGSGHENEGIELVELAFDRLDTILDELDLSERRLERVVGRLKKLHLELCLKGTPDTRALARRLFRRDLAGGWGFFTDAYRTYKEALGPEGEEEFRRLAETEWKHVVALKPGEQAEWSSNRHALSRIMEVIAEESNDVEAVVEVLRRDLSDSSAYVRIATAYANAGQHDKALQWAEEGYRIFSDDLGMNLILFLVREYERRGDTWRTLELAREVFYRWPSVDTYAALRQHAERARKWKSTREEALRFVREELPMSSGYAYFHGRMRDRSFLVELLLSDGDIDAAWREAIDGGCNAVLWVQLADARATKHPADAIAVYREQALAQIALSNYDVAVDLLAKLGALMKRLKKGKEYERLLDDIRAAHPRKRKLRELMGRLQI